MSCYDEDLLKDDTPFEEKCARCVHKDNKHNDPHTCGSCFGESKGVLYGYKHFKKEN